MTRLRNHQEMTESNGRSQKDVVKCALLVCVLRQPVAPSNHPSLHLVDVLTGGLLGDS